MEYTVHTINDHSILEVHSPDFVIHTLQDALDLLGSAMFMQVFKIIIGKENLCADFYDLKTRLAGEILQKFSTYDMQLAIIGEFGNVESGSLRDFIKESNRTGRILFLGTLEEAKVRLAAN